MFFLKVKSETSIPKCFLSLISYNGTVKTLELHRVKPVKHRASKQREPRTSWKISVLDIWTELNLQAASWQNWLSCPRNEKPRQEQSLSF